MVDRRSADKGKKLICSQMQEQLQLSHPDNFYIMYVHDIKNVVNAVLRAARKMHKLPHREYRAVLQGNNGTCIGFRVTRLPYFHGFPIHMTQDLLSTISMTQDPISLSLLQIHTAHLTTH